MSHARNYRSPDVTLTSHLLQVELIFDHMAKGSWRCFLHTVFWNGRHTVMVYHHSLFKQSHPPVNKRSNSDQIVTFKYQNQFTSHVTPTPFQRHHDSLLDS